MSLKPKKFKSLLVSSIYFPPQVGGISQYMASVVQCFHPEEICCLTGVPAAHQGEEDFQARVYRRPRVFSNGLLAPRLAGAGSLSEIILRDHPQVVQIATAYDGYIGLHLQRWLKLPFVVYAHGNEILDAASSSWLKPKLSLQNSARVLANSNFTAQLVAAAGVDSQKIVVLHPGCDPDRFRPVAPCPSLRQELLPPHGAGRIILTVGNLVARKGHDMVLRALPQLLRQTPDAVYLIAGDGPYRAELEKLACQLGVQHHVVFAGRVPHEKLPQIYALADVFVMPSRVQLEACDVEGFGMVFLEASACGKPVVAGNSGGIPDAVIDGITGFVVDPRDENAIASSIGRILRFPDLARKLGEQGRRRVLQDFTWARFASRLRELLACVVQEQRLASTRP